MKILFLILLSYLVVAPNLSHTASAESKYDFRYKNWTGHARFSKSGEFARCTAEAPYKSGIKLSFAINVRGILEIWMYKREWNLRTGEKLKIRFRVDRSRYFSGRMEVLGKRLAQIYVNKSNTFFQFIRKGYTLYIYGSGNTLEFSLDGTARALDKLRDCWDRNSPPSSTASRSDSRGSGSPNNPFSNKARKPSSKAGASFARLILNTLSLDGFEIRKNVPDAIKKLKPSLYWTAPDAFGIAHEAQMLPTINMAKTMISKGDKKDCVGEFAVAAKEKALSNGRKIFAIKSACTESKDGIPVFVVYTYYPTKSGGGIRISHLGVSPDAPSNADLKFLEQVNKALKNR
jgi:hypothetical protein